jgi:hypothetical protein
VVFLTISLMSGYVVMYLFSIRYEFTTVRVAKVVGVGVHFVYKPIAAQCMEFLIWYFIST